MNVLKSSYLQKSLEVSRTLLLPAGPSALASSTRTADFPARQGGSDVPLATVLILLTESVRIRSIIKLLGRMMERHRFVLLPGECREPY